MEPQIGDGSFQFGADPAVAAAAAAATAPGAVPAPEGGFQPDPAAGGQGGFQF